MSWKEMGYFARDFNFYDSLECHSIHILAYKRERRFSFIEQETAKSWPLMKRVGGKGDEGAKWISISIAKFFSKASFIFKTRSMCKVLCIFLHYYVLIFRVWNE